ncbi:hypothetical protein CSQ89_21575 [Chitinimonas sp. BJB300]|nr:hypothetical protein CSQ89_21575 [Chitinimonas sp. BJB300]TSJ89112.1 hypothetical protein FG002_009585 [Chitinimonas sp. BJB300]
MLKAKGTGIDALDEAIRASGGIGFEDAFRRWGSMLAFPDAKALPAGYGYPGVKVGDYTSPAWNGSDIAKYYAFPATLPDTIKPYSHLPLVEPNQSGQYTREVKVPPGVTLSVYIQ